MAQDQCWLGYPAGYLPAATTTFRQHGPSLPPEKSRKWPLQTLAPTGACWRPDLQDLGNKTWQVPQMAVQALGYPREEMWHQHLANLNVENTASLLFALLDGGLLIYSFLEYLSAYSAGSWGE